MQTHTATTPFGRRPMTLGLIASQVTAKHIDQDAKVSKWQVFRDIREAKEVLGATDRALAILNALLTFHRDEELTGEGNLVVFPSNEQLIRRANGMSPATLRRHLANLVMSGLVIRRDSPNGKRFARKGQGGAIEQAYGFDLSPILARAAEFRELAEAVAAERKAFRLVRERLTICRRDVVKMIEAGINESVPGNWRGFQRRYESIIARLPRTAPRQALEAIANELEDLWADVHQTLELFVELQNLNANESHSEPHKQNSNTESPIESKNGSRTKEEASGSAEEPANVERLPERDLPLGIVLDACPAIRDLSGGSEIRHWRDFIAVTEDARPMLGISPSAWRDAVNVLGARQAAITLAGIYQRSDQINNAGGYLRSLTDRAREAKFSTWPMIMALLRARNDESHSNDTRREEGAGSMSDALKRSLDKRNWT